MASYRVPEHIWRTKDGRLVLTGDPDAAFLAYARGDEMAEDEARRLGVLDAAAGRQAQAVQGKPVATKGGVTIKRLDKEKANG